MADALRYRLERANAPVTATDIEQRVEDLFFGLPEPSERGVAASARDLQRYTGEYLDNAGPVHVTTDGRALTARPGIRHHAQSRLVPEGQDLFLAEDEPSIELRFQVGGDQARAYGRYHNGWFSALAMRSR